MIANGLVSIHAPRAGRDVGWHDFAAPCTGFNPRAPRGARLCGLRAGVDEHGCFNPRAPRGARPAPQGILLGLLLVSIHAPRAGRDDPWPIVDPSAEKFQSTRPARGATRGKPAPPGRPTCFNPRAPRGARRVPAGVLLAGVPVSIHAPRAGRDPGRERVVVEVFSFNPRAPRGARLAPGRCSASNNGFQSTRPARGATPQSRFNDRDRGVSIHAPRAGRDPFQDRFSPS